jgi:hypothetical protein
MQVKLAGTATLGSPIDEDVTVPAHGQRQVGLTVKPAISEGRQYASGHLLRRPMPHTLGPAVQ